MANYPTGATVTNEVDPVSRIEGHLGVAVNVVGGKIQDAYAHGNLWRGFENFLLNRTANDAITFVQRICGVCPVPHGMTSTYAVDTVLGYSAGHITFAYDAGDGNGVPVKAVLIRNLVLGMEFLMSSITHFYHLAAPSYVQGPNIPPWTPYFDNTYYHPYLRSGGAVLPKRTLDGGYSDDLWSTVIRSYVTALRIRRLTFEAGALFAGRMPMTSVLVGGGVTFNGTEDLSARCETFRGIAQEVGRFVIQEYVPIVLALGALYPNFDNLVNAGVLNTNFPALWTAAGNSVAPDGTNTGYGAGLGRFLAWGGFPDTTSTGTLTLPGGVIDVNTVPQVAHLTVLNKADVASTFLTGPTSVPNKLTEDISNSRYDVDSRDTAAYAVHSGNAAYPGLVSRTKPKRSNGYSYMKAPRWDGYPCEVGPMARMYVSAKFVKGDALSAHIPSYAKYLKGAGLEPKMIHPDIAVALLRMGLATLTVAPVGSTTAALTAAYADPAQTITGPINAWIRNITAGLSTIDRLRARGLESLVLIEAILGSYDVTQGHWVIAANGTATYADSTGVTPSWAGGWVTQLKNATGGTWRNLSIPPASVGEIQGWGGTEAPRGALMHQMTILGGKITKYQCIVPTTWNGSPMDANGRHGAIEAAVMGNPWSTAGASFTSQGGGNVTTAGGVEVLRAAQSFDPCIACAIH